MYLIQNNSPKPNYGTSACKDDRCKEWGTLGHKWKNLLREAESDFLSHCTVIKGTAQEKAPATFQEGLPSPDQMLNFPLCDMSRGPGEASRRGCETGLSVTGVLS